MGEKAYLKSDLEHLGSGVPALRRVLKGVEAENPELARTPLLRLVRALWSRPIFDCRLASVELLAAHPHRLRSGDLSLTERMIRTAKTWALVDPLAIGVAGGIVADHPEAVAVLDRWVRDEDFWVRRASMLALLRPLRAGAGDFSRFGRYADRLLDEKEFFIRKAIGWVLRETARRRPALVYEWLAPRTHRASGVTMREAVKPMAPAQADKLMKAYREGRPSG